MGPETDSDLKKMSDDEKSPGLLLKNPNWIGLLDVCVNYLEANLSMEKWFGCNASNLNFWNETLLKNPNWKKRTTRRWSCSKIRIGKRGQLGDDPETSRKELISWRLVRLRKKLGLSFLFCSAEDQNCKNQNEINEIEDKMKINSELLLPCKLRTK